MNPDYISMREKVEIFQHPKDYDLNVDAAAGDALYEHGFYYWPVSDSGALPDGDATGPFESLRDAEEGIRDYILDHISTIRKDKYFVGVEADYIRAHEERLAKLRTKKTTHNQLVDICCMFAPKSNTLDAKSTERVASVSTFPYSCTLHVSAHRDESLQEMLLELSLLLIEEGLMTNDIFAELEEVHYQDEKSMIYRHPKLPFTIQAHYQRSVRCREVPTGEMIAVTRIVCE